MNRYRDGGRVREFVADAPPPPLTSPLPRQDRVERRASPEEATEPRVAEALRDVKEGLERLFARILPGRWETEDLLIAAILYLLYRESGEREWLMAMGAYLLL